MQHLKVSIALEGYVDLADAEPLESIVEKLLIGVKSNDNLMATRDFEFYITSLDNERERSCGLIERCGIKN